MESIPFYVYDLETMYNCFLFTGKYVGTDSIRSYEISTRRNDRTELLAWLNYLQNSRSILVGYNNIGFDYPIIHELLTNPYVFDHNTAYMLAQQIISQQQGYGFDRIRLSDRLLPQLDLMKMNHFDNPAKRTSLKALQFSMRSESVEDLPFAFNTPLTNEQMDLMREYNVHDVTETEKFFWKCWPMIQMRQELLENGVIGGDVLNYSDVKIGTEYLIKKIGRAKCFISGSKPRQTIRSQIEFNQIILPKIHYRTEPFRSVHDWFNRQVVYLSSDERPRLETTLAGLQFHFGVGGVHASAENRTYESNETHVILDVDVAGMYPAVAIANGFAPEHLGQDFVTAYRQLSVDRKQHAKGSVMNLILKLANNGVFGNSNNPYSCFYDPKYTFSVTVNGQLQLIQLVELLSMVPGVELIQANTDGVTAYVPRAVEKFFQLWCNEWECITGLKLEHVRGKRMWIRDVNNYIFEDENGNLKRKGAYWYPIRDEDYQGSSGSNWNKDFSNMVAQKAVERVLVDGYRPEDVVRLFTNPFDFMLRYKTPGGAKLYIGDKEQLRTVRYYVSTAGEPMKKIAQPKGEIGAWKRKNGIKDEFYKKILSEIPAGAHDERIHTKNKSKYAAVTTSVESGRKVRQCNRATDFRWGDVDWAYYIEETKKLVIGANQ